MDALIKEFLTFLRVEKELVPRTIREYEMKLNMLKDFLIEREHVTSWTDVTYPHLRSFLLYLADERHNSPRSRAAKISCMRTFFKYLYLEELISRPIGDRLIKPKFEHKLPVYLTMEECQRFIQLIREKSLHSVRDTTIILTFLYTGVRLTELCQLNLNDIDWEKETIKVLGKGRKERLIPISHQLKIVLLNYVEYRHGRLGIEHDQTEPLFVSRRHQQWNRINRRTIHDLFKQYAKEARINAEYFTAHKLRHTFATLLYSSGVELIELQQLLGHSNLHTTQIYTHTSVEQLKSAINKNPLNIKEHRSIYFASPSLSIQ